MERIENYINSVYKNVQGNQCEIEDLKQEMKSHLLQTVEELKDEGKTEDESIKIAISRFGEREQVENELGKVFKVQRKFAKIILIASIVSLLLAAGCYSGYKITSDMFRLRIPEPFRAAVEYKLEAGETISDEEVAQLLTKYKKQFRYIGIYKDDNYSEIPNIIYPSNYSREEIENDENTLTTYPTSTNGYVWKVQYGFNENAFNLFIPICLHSVFKMFFIAYWLLFFTWCVINAHYKNNLSLVWIILFFTLNIVGYMIYVLDRMNNLRLRSA